MPDGHYGDRGDARQVERAQRCKQTRGNLHEIAGGPELKALAPSWQVSRVRTQEAPRPAARRALQASSLALRHIVAARGCPGDVG